MEALTGQRNNSARGLLHYFEPLRVWLENENARNAEFIGWNENSMVKIKETSKSSAMFILPNVLLIWLSTTVV